MIICSLTFNSEFGFDQMFTLLTLLGVVYFYFRFNKKLNTQQKKLNDQQITLNSQLHELNDQQNTLNSQQEILNEQVQELNGQQIRLNDQQEALNGQIQELNGQQIKLNDQQETINGQLQQLNDQKLKLNELQIDEQTNVKKADLQLSLIRVDTYHYNLIVDNMGESRATDITIFSDDNLFSGENKGVVVLQTPLEPHRCLLAQQFFSVDDKMDFSIHWTDRSGSENSNGVTLNTASIPQYEERLKNLYKKVPGIQEPVDLAKVAQELKAHNDLKEELKKYFNQMGEDITDDKIEEIIAQM